MSNIRITVRLTPQLRQAIMADAAAHGRTVAQSVRFLLETALEGKGQ